MSDRRFSWRSNMAKEKTKTMVPFPAGSAHRYPQGRIYKIRENFGNLFTFRFFRFFCEKRIINNKRKNAGWWSKHTLFYLNLLGCIILLILFDVFNECSLSIELKLWRIYIICDWNLCCLLLLFPNFNFLTEAVWRQLVIMCKKISFFICFASHKCSHIF